MGQLRSLFPTCTSPLPNAVILWFNNKLLWKVCLTPVGIKELSW